MKELANKKIILWDFDGVILDSMDVREEGFKEVLSSYPEAMVTELIRYHRKNGGLSRYVKFRYFFEEIKNEELQDIDKKISALASEYSRIMRKSLISKDRLIDEVLDFIRRNRNNYAMHLVSGSDGNELRYLCDELNISDFFRSMEGSPTPKVELVEKIIAKNRYLPEETCLIGDSINDFDAARRNQIVFFGYNNTELKEKGAGYITSFRGL